MNDAIRHSAEHPTIAKLISMITIFVSGLTVTDTIPYVLGIIATTAGIAASITVFRAQRAVRIKTEIEIDTLRRLEAERLERAKNSPGRRLDD